MALSRSAIRRVGTSETPRSFLPVWYQFDFFTCNPAQSGQLQITSIASVCRLSTTASGAMAYFDMVESPCFHDCKTVVDQNCGLRERERENASSCRGIESRALLGTTLAT